MTSERQATPKSSDVGPNQPDTQILWIAPFLNHYKLQFLNHLADQELHSISIFAGGKLSGGGYVETVPELDANVQLIRNKTDYRRFAFSPAIYWNLIRTIRRQRFDIVVMPIEKKHLPLIAFLVALRFLYRFRLVSYNHPCLRSKGRIPTTIDYQLTRFLFRRYDRIIFYTEQGRQWAIDHKLIGETTSGFANNTLDTRKIWEESEFQINHNESKSILFIGRLVDYKRLDLLIDYFDHLKSKIDLTLQIVGDGPAAVLARDAASKDPKIVWHGAIIEESAIAERMREAHIVFIPGSSGLSIVHSFCYGKPYVTIEGDQFTHGPEIDYVIDGKNGLRLSKTDFDGNVDRIVSLLSNSNYERACKAAYETARGLSIDDWTAQMSDELLTSIHKSEHESSSTSLERQTQ